LSTALCGHHLVNPRTDFPYRAPLSAPAPFIGTRAPLSIPSTVLYGTDYLLQHRFVESSTVSESEHRFVDAGTALHEHHLVIPSTDFNNSAPVSATGTVYLDDGTDFNGAHRFM
jgi:hypothetical protein